MYRNDELNLDSESSRPQRNSNVTGETFRSLLTNSRENSEATIETTRLINEEIANQMSKRLNEIKSSLNSQIQSAITAAIADTVLPFIQNTLEMQGRTNFTMVDRASNGPHPGPRTDNFTMGDRRSSELQRNPEVGNSQKTWEIRPETCFTLENGRQRSRESSVDSYIGEQNRDILHWGYTLKIYTRNSNRTLNNPLLAENHYEHGKFEMNQFHFPFNFLHNGYVYF